MNGKLRTQPTPPYLALVFLGLSAVNAARWDMLSVFFTVEQIAGT
jgi:hypothetical protein